MTSTFSSPGTSPDDLSNSIDSLNQPLEAFFRLIGRFAGRSNEVASEDASFLVQTTMQTLTALLAAHLSADQQNELQVKLGSNQLNSAEIGQFLSQGVSQNAFSKSLQQALEVVMRTYLKQTGYTPSPEDRQQLESAIRQMVAGGTV